VVDSSKVLDTSVAKQLANLLLIGGRDLGGASQLELHQSSSRGILLGIVITTELARVFEHRLDEEVSIPPSTTAAACQGRVFVVGLRVKENVFVIGLRVKENVDIRLDPDLLVDDVDHIVVRVLVAIVESELDGIIDHGGFVRRWILIETLDLNIDMKLGGATALLPVLLLAEVVERRLGRSSEAPKEGEGEEETGEHDDLMVFGCKDCERSGFGFPVLNIVRRRWMFLEQLGFEKGGGDRTCIEDIRSCGAITLCDSC
jgi:hypothetical protein